MYDKSKSQHSKYLTIQ